MVNIPAMELEIGNALAKTRPTIIATLEVVDFFRKRSKAHSDAIDGNPAMRAILTDGPSLAINFRKVT